MDCLVHSFLQDQNLRYIQKYRVSFVSLGKYDVNHLKQIKSDVNGFIAKLFGVPTGQGGAFKTTVDNTAVTLLRSKTTSRWTFILDDQGKVIYKDTQVSPQQDTAKVIEFIQGLK